MFTTILETTSTGTVSTEAGLTCIVTGIILGLVISLIYMFNIVNCTTFNVFWFNKCVN